MFNDDVLYERRRELQVCECKYISMRLPASQFLHRCLNGKVAAVFGPLGSKEVNKSSLSNWMIHTMSPASSREP